MVVLPFVTFPGRSYSTWSVYRNAACKERGRGEAAVTAGHTETPSGGKCCSSSTPSHEKMIK